MSDYRQEILAARIAAIGDAETRAALAPLIDAMTTTQMLPFVMVIARLARRIADLEAR
jgi:hypothetical protein